ncbi:unnamed protein product [Albugo candida]|uniref:Uncharacterized protein n=1 Tax=Albugo candida TaxID=65357 RepID=A0A024FX86_9STRA|nr:unnamed protein product [Albugo candida]|eukprot:CCI11798.1 unnamed protein product [Albugo candida]
MMNKGKKRWNKVARSFLSLRIAADLFLFHNIKSLCNISINVLVILIKLVFLVQVKNAVNFKTLTPIAFDAPLNASLCFLVSVCFENKLRSSFSAWIEMTLKKNAASNLVLIISDC